MERNMRCGARPLRPLPARPDADLPRRPGLPLRRDGAADGGAGAVSDAAQADARRLEVRLLRRLPALAARLRGRAARARRRGRDRVLPRGDERDGRRARTTSRSSRARSRRRTTPSGSSEMRRAVEDARHDRRLRDRRRHPGAAELRRRRRLHLRRLRDARVHLDARDVDADRRPRPRSTSSCSGCPINKHQLLEVIAAFLARPPAEHPGDERLHRVQARAAPSA